MEFGQVLDVRYLIFLAYLSPFLVLSRLRDDLAMFIVPICVFRKMYMHD